MRPVALVILAACTAEEMVTPFDVEPVPFEEAVESATEPVDGTVALRTPLGFGVDPLIPGQRTTLEVTGLAPGETTYVAYSLYGTGNGICPPAMGGVCLNLLSPVQLLGTAVADAGGVAVLTPMVPANAPIGMQVSLQAVAIRGIGGAQTVKSPAITELVQAVPAGDDFAHVPAAVDLLFVIDDSCSMFEEQTNLANSFGPMLQAIAAIDLSMHVGVVTTDMVDPSKSGRLQRDNSGNLWIDDANPAPATSFAQMAAVGTYGSAYEEGLRAMSASLNVAANAGFRRPEAQYAVVVVSDEEDQSTGMTPNSAANVIFGQEAHPGDGTFTSIVTPRLNCVPNGVSPGNRYLQTTSLVGGAEESICAADYSPALIDLTSLWWTSQPYVLSAVPANPGAIAVTVDGQPVAAADWVYDAVENTIRFTNGFAPVAGAAVHVDY